VISYTVLLFIHSWLRWALLALAVVVLFRSIARGRTGAPWTTSDRTLTVMFTAVLDTQVLLGFGLYFGASPFTPRTMEAFRAAMKVSYLRFFAVEHIFAMIFALVAAHVGVASAKRAEDDPTRYKRIAMGVAVALLAIAAGIPWPGMPYARPLFRF
jgi:uncharacterized membrane protein YozB (DUF420 family)